MGTKLASELIADAAGLYNDNDFERIDEEPGGDNVNNWLDFINYGQSQLVIFRPQANVVSVVYPLVEGTKQRIPDGSALYQEVGVVGTLFSPTSCCTDPDDDTDNTTGWIPLRATLASGLGGVGGGYALSVTATSDPNGAARFDGISVTAGNKYYIKFNGAADLGDSYSLWLYYPTSTDTEPFADGVAGQGAVWDSYETIFTAQYTDTAIIYAIADADTDVAYFDNLQLYELGPAQEGIQLVKIVRNMGTDGLTPGNSVTVADVDTMDREFPGWHSETGSAAVTNYMYDERDPYHFWVTPPQPSSGQGYVEAQISSVPTDLTAKTEVISLSDIYYHTLLDYLLYRAYLIDADSSPYAAQKAMGHYNQFLTAIGRKDLILKQLSPNQPQAMEKIE